MEFVFEIKQTLNQLFEWAKLTKTAHYLPEHNQSIPQVSFGIVFHFWKLCPHLVSTLQNIPEAALCFMKWKNSPVCQLMLGKKMPHCYSYCLPCACGFLYLPLFEMSATESVSKCIRPPEWQYKWGLAAVDATDNFQKTTHRLWCYFRKRLPYRSEEENCQMATLMAMNWNCEF